MNTRKRSEIRPLFLRLLNSLKTNELTLYKKYKETANNTSVEVTRHISALLHNRPESLSFIDIDTRFAASLGIHVITDDIYDCPDEYKTKL